VAGKSIGRVTLARRRSHLAAEVLREMILQKLTQGEVAARAGVSRCHLCNWLNGKHNPKERFVLRVASALGSDFRLVRTAEEEGAV
jgi:transcriptional regulator with XRE-family HTH domain